MTRVFPLPTVFPLPLAPINGRNPHWLGQGSDRFGTLWHRPSGPRICPTLYLTVKSRKLKWFCMTYFGNMNDACWLCHLCDCITVGIYPDRDFNKSICIWSIIHWWTVVFVDDDTAVAVWALLDSEESGRFAGSAQLPWTLPLMELVVVVVLVMMLSLLSMCLDSIVGMAIGFADRKCDQKDTH